MKYIIFSFINYQLPFIIYFSQVVVLSHPIIGPMTGSILRTSCSWSSVIKNSTKLKVLRKLLKYCSSGRLSQSTSFSKTLEKEQWRTPLVEHTFHSLLSQESEKEKNA